MLPLIKQNPILYSLSAVMESVEMMKRDYCDDIVPDVPGHFEL